MVWPLNFTSVLLILGCHALELCSYLSSIDPKILILNGDIIDFWQLKTSYFPSSHMQVLHTIMEMIGCGVEVHYLTGNHDDILRRFSDFTLGNFRLSDKIVLEIDGKKYWFFHGDVFDSLVVEARWIAKLGSYGYDFLIVLNRIYNWAMDSLGRPRSSLSKRVKQGVKRALLHIENFERTIADLAFNSGYNAVVCGHIHEPVIKEIRGHEADVSVLYMNSGDWVESLTTLELLNGTWQIYDHYKSEVYFAEIKEAQTC